MKHFLSLLLLLAASLSLNADGAFVIPIHTEIDRSAYHHFKQALVQARDAHADIIIVELNTYGGAVDAADSIRTAILRLPLPTVAFVDVNAASAGALIALSCDSVYMAPAASMGSATVVNGAGEPMPQKYQSYMATIMRATAEHHGRVVDGDSMRWRRNPEVAASMVNPDMSVSLTATQAVACGYADGIAPDIAAVMADLHRAGEPVTYYQSTLTDDLLGFLSNAAVRAILVALILGGIYMEMHTPGLGFAAAVSLVATVLFFLPVIVAGSIPSWVILCFIIGVILIALELFVIPGFGIAGITGIIAVAAALTGAMVSTDSVSGVDLGSIGRSLVLVVIGCIIAAGIVLWLTSRHGPRRLRRHTELLTELTVADGFVGVDMSMQRFVGQTAVTVTDMRPSGKIEIGSRIYDAVSAGEFITAHKPVKIIRYENAQLYVVATEHDR